MSRMSEMTFKSKKRLENRQFRIVDWWPEPNSTWIHVDSTINPYCIYGLWPAMQVLLLELARSSETKKNRNFLHAKEALKGDTSYRT